MYKKYEEGKNKEVNINKRNDIKRWHLLEL